MFRRSSLALPVCASTYCIWRERSQMRKRDTLRLANPSKAAVSRHAPFSIFGQVPFCRPRVVAAQDHHCLVSSFVDNLVAHDDEHEPRSKRERVTALRQKFGTDDGWTEAISFQGIRCSYQRGGSGDVRVRAEAEIDVPLFDLITLFYEVDFWHLWAPKFGNLGLQKARRIDHSRTFSFVDEVQASLPWPFWQRTCRYAVDAIDCMSAGDEPQQLVILMDSKEAQRRHPRLLAEASRDGNTEAELIQSGLVLTPAGVGRTKKTLVQGVLRIDPNMRVPDFLLVLTLMNLCWMIFMQFKKASELTRTPEFLERSCDPTHPFYSHVRKRMRECLPHEFALAPPERQS